MQNITKLPIKHDQIIEAVERLADKINKDFRDKDPILLCVLDGAFMFFSDLVQRLTIKHEIGFVKVSSYGDEQTPGIISWSLQPPEAVKDRIVIIVDDILDTGATARFIISNLRMRHVKRPTMCVLLSKMAHRKHAIACSRIGFEIDDHFVYGYGLDREGRDRNLLNIYAT